MADTEEPLAEGPAQEPAPESEAQQPQPDPVEALAAEMGWAPKDQFRDPDKWKPAREFILAGRDIHQSTSRELRSVREQLERVAGVTEGIVRDKVAERDAYWREQHRQAVESGDVEAADKAVKELTKPQPATAPQGPPPEVREWIGRNPWFNSDPLAATRAQEIADRLARQGHDTATQLREAERAIRKEFPEHFPAAAKAPPAVATGQSRNAAPSNRARGFADMPQQSQAMAVDMERRLGVKKEDFAARYWAEQQQRKVG